MYQVWSPRAFPRPSYSNWRWRRIDGRVPNFGVDISTSTRRREKLLIPKESPEPLVSKTVGRSRCLVARSTGDSVDHVQNVEKSEIFGTSGGHISMGVGANDSGPTKGTPLKFSLSNETTFSFVAGRDDNDTLYRMAKTCVFAIFGPILGSRP